MRSSNYLQTPEASAAVAEGSGYNPVVTGADALLSDVAKKNFQEAFPGDALKNLWHRPAEPSWFARTPQPVRRQVQGRLIGLPDELDSQPRHRRGWFVFEASSWLLLDLGARFGGNSVDSCSKNSRQAGDRMRMSAGVELDHVTVRFGQFTAVDDATLDIKGGEFFSFLGPSGCGKTTILRTVSGFLDPSAGAGPHRRPGHGAASAPTSGRPR